MMVAAAAALTADFPSRTALRSPRRRARPCCGASARAQGGASRWVPRRGAPPFESGPGPGQPDAAPAHRHLVAADRFPRREQLPGTPASLTPPYSLHSPPTPGRGPPRGGGRSPGCVSRLRRFGRRPRRIAEPGELRRVGAPGPASGAAPWPPGMRGLKWDPTRY